MSGGEIERGAQFVAHAGVEGVPRRRPVQLDGDPRVTLLDPHAGFVRLHSDARRIGQPPGPETPGSQQHGIANRFQRQRLVEIEPQGHPQHLGGDGRRRRLAFDLPANRAERRLQAIGRDAHPGGRRIGIVAQQDVECLQPGRGLRGTTRQADANHACTRDCKRRGIEIDDQQAGSAKLDKIGQDRVHQGRGRRFLGMRA